MTETRNLLFHRTMRPCPKGHTWSGRWMLEVCLLILLRRWLCGWEPHSVITIVKCQMNERDNIFFKEYRSAPIFTWKHQICLKATYFAILACNYRKDFLPSNFLLIWRKSKWACRIMNCYCCHMWPAFLTIVLNIETSNSVERLTVVLNRCTSIFIEIVFEWKTVLQFSVNLHNLTQNKDRDFKIGMKITHTQVYCFFIQLVKINRICL